MFKIYSSSSSLVITSRWFATSRLVAPVSVRLVYCDVTSVPLWRHANAVHCYCDVIFVDCSCTRQLAQSRYSRINYKREYRFSVFTVQRVGDGVSLAWEFKAWSVWFPFVVVVVYTAQYCYIESHLNEYAMCLVYNAHAKVSMPSLVVWYRSI